MNAKISGGGGGIIAVLLTLLTLFFSFVALFVAPGGWLMVLTVTAIALRSIHWPLKMWAWIHIPIVISSLICWWASVFPITFKQYPILLLIGCIIWSGAWFGTTVVEKKKV